MSERCIGTNKAGRQCSAKALPGSTLCPWHHPGWAAQVKEWNQRGGSSRSNAARARKRLPADALTIAELRGVLGRAITDVSRGDLEPGVGSCLASLARAYIVVVEAESLEEMSRRLDSLERQATRHGGIA
jgi:hypothetical protein